MAAGVGGAASGLQGGLEPASRARPAGGAGRENREAGWGIRPTNRPGHTSGGAGAPVYTNVLTSVSQQKHKEAWKHTV